uniref:hypothetical protein n=1 Tax=Candidatus Electrothrix sp. TaxID=2170559 RepID=UPI0040573C6F
KTHKGDRRSPLRHTHNHFKTPTFSAVAKISEHRLYSSYEHGNFSAVLQDFSQLDDRDIRGGVSARTVLIRNRFEISAFSIVAKPT